MFTFHERNKKHKMMMILTCEKKLKKLAARERRERNINVIRENSLQCNSIWRVIKQSVRCLFEYKNVRKTYYDEFNLKNNAKT